MTNATSSTRGSLYTAVLDTAGTVVRAVIIHALSVY